MGNSILKSRLLWAISLIMLIFAYTLTKSQTEAEELVVDSREFYFNFMPNVHQQSLMEIDLLYVFITSVKPANVTIEAYDLNGVKKVETVPIQANSHILKAYDFRKYELPGDFVSSTSYNKSQTPLKCGFHITSDENIYVYTLTSSPYSSDAMIIYPVNSLGKKNYILSYKSDFNFSNGRTPSQFSIMATEDSTIVNIVPSVRTSQNNSEKFSVILNKGESYLVQAGLEYDSQKGYKTPDLTGTYIEANNNIAVFAGHQRATIPLLDYLDNPSRDFICEQLIPVETWGKDAFVTPFPYSKTDVPSHKDIFRIISSTDKNKIRIGKETIVLNKGQVYEAEILEALAIFAEFPIMTAQYKRSSRLYYDPFDNVQYNSDPLMILVPPVEQFLKDAIIYNISNNSSMNIYNKYISFSEQYLVIVAPDSSTNKCYIDENLISQKDFIKIQNSTYSYVTLKYEQGIHYFRSNAKCGLYVYGYGQANSYGYTGGMIPRYIDVTKPDISSIPDCYSHLININDNIGYSYGLKSAELVDSLSSNVKFIGNNDDILNKYEGNSSLELIDNNQDGYYTIKVTDKSGNITFYTDTISGNALQFVNLDQDNKISINGINQFEQKCSIIILHNRGIQTKTIEKLEHVNTKNYSIPASQFPLTIRPDEKKPITICVNYRNSKEVPICDTINLKGECGEIDAFIETEFNPYNVDIDTKCGLPIKLTVTSIPDELFIEDAKLLENNTIANTIFGINIEGLASVNLFDLNGKLVKEIFSGEIIPGIYSSNILIDDLNSGVYFINLSVKGNTVSSKVIIAK